MGPQRGQPHFVLGGRKDVSTRSRLRAKRGAPAAPPSPRPKPAFEGSMVMRPPNRAQQFGLYLAFTAIAVYALARLIWS